MKPLTRFVGEFVALAVIMLIVLLALTWLGSFAIHAQTPPLPIPPEPTAKSACPPPQQGYDCTRIYVRDGVTLKSVDGARIQFEGRRQSSRPVPLDGYTANFRRNSTPQFVITVPSGYIPPKVARLQLDGPKTWIIDVYLKPK